VVYDDGVGVDDPMIVFARELAGWTRFLDDLRLRRVACYDIRP
jgi:hypothetical protein